MCRQCCYSSYGRLTKLDTKLKIGLDPIPTDEVSQEHTSLWAPHRGPQRVATYKGPSRVEQLHESKENPPDLEASPWYPTGRGEAKPPTVESVWSAGPYAPVMHA